MFHGDLTVPNPTVPSSSFWKGRRDSEQELYLKPWRSSLFSFFGCWIYSPIRQRWIKNTESASSRHQSQQNAHHVLYFLPRWNFLTTNTILMTFFFLDGFCAHVYPHKCSNEGHHCSTFYPSEEQLIFCSKSHLLQRNYVVRAEISWDRRVMNSPLGRNGKIFYLPDTSFLF